MGVGISPDDSCGRLLRGRRGRDQGTTLLRGGPARTGSPVWRVHDGMPPQRKEHPGEELPVPLAEVPGRGATDDDGDRLEQFGEGYAIDVKRTDSRRARRIYANRSSWPPARTTPAFCAR